MTSTPRISALRPGLAIKATSICLCSRKATRPTSTTKTSIRNRKMRGLDSLSGSRSLAMSFTSERRLCGSVRNMAQTRDKEKANVPEPLKGKRLNTLKLGRAVARRFEHPHDLFLDGVVAGHDVAFAHYLVAAVAVADKATGFTDQD